MLWDATTNFQGFEPYLIGDAGYPLLPWLMVPHRRDVALPVALALFNRRLSRARSVVENAFALLKHSFRELQQRSYIDVALMPDVVVCCAILHNILLRDSHEAVERLLQIVQYREDDGSAVQEPLHPEHAADVAVLESDQEGALQKRQDLGVFLTLHRGVRQR